MMGILGNVEIEVRDAATGRVLRRQRSRNKMPDSGLDLSRDLFGGAGLRPDEIAVGTGTGATADTTTALETEVFRRAIDRRIRLSKQIKYQLLLLTTDANGNTLSEVGLFEQGTLVARALISPTIAKTSAIEVAISHTLIFKAA